MDIDLIGSGQRLLAEPFEVCFLSQERLNEGQIDMKKIDIARIPELATSVGMQGSVKQKEVGGPMCLAALTGIALMLMGGR